MVFKKSKYLFFLTYCVIAFGCSEKREPKDFCATSLTYRSRRLELIPDLIRLNIQDKDHFLLKKLKSYTEVDKVLFYSMPVADREYFLAGSIIPRKDSVTVQVTTSFFNSERGRKVWKSKEVENLLLKDSIEVIVGKDTIVVKRCK